MNRESGRGHKAVNEAAGIQEHARGRQEDREHRHGRQGVAVEVKKTVTEAADGLNTTEAVGGS